MQVQPYLHFNGRCEEAIEFYRRALGAEVIELHRFKESPNPAMCTPDTDVLRMVPHIGTIKHSSKGDTNGEPLF